MSRNLVLYISCSLDGYIATKDDGLEWLNAMEKEGEDYGYAAFNDTVDTIIIGRRTYDKVISMGFDYPGNDKKVYVITSQKRDDKGNVTFYHGNVSELIDVLKLQEGKNIYCDGGAALVHYLLKNRLIDEMIVSVIPILLGDGIRLFSPEFPSQTLKLLETKAFEKGLVQLHYSLMGRFEKKI